MGFDEIADELYGLPPEEFVAARERHVQRARADGDRELAERLRALRRPALSAWLANLLLRERGEQVGALLSLGEGLAAAQRSLSGEALRQLTVQRHQLVDALGREARHLARQAGHPVSEDTGRELRTTLEAALADPEAAEQVRSGRLTKPLSYAGFGARPDASAPPPSQTRPDAHRPDAHRPDARRLAQAQRAVADAEQADARAADALSSAESALDSAQRRLEDAAGRVAELDEALRAAREAQAAAERDRTEAQRAHREARRAAQTSHRELLAARQRLADLGG